jgi:hypothetical protein
VTQRTRKHRHTVINFKDTTARKLTEEATMADWIGHQYVTLSGQDAAS